MTSPSVAASWATLVPLAWDSATLASYTDWLNVGVLSFTFVTLTVNVPVPCNNTLDVWLCVHARACVRARVRASASEHACILVFALPLTCFKTYVFVCLVLVFVKYMVFVMIKHRAAETLFIRHCMRCQIIN